jgi:glycosyltransferase involved in cell wall biosynthesis
MSPGISVALCAYNGSAFLEEQLLSILNQTLRPAELVVSDDGSTDGSADLVLGIFGSWQARNPGVEISLRVLRNETPLGVTANFEQALSACAGELIALSDQDDVWHADRLARIASEFGRRPSLCLLHTDARLVDAQGHPLGTTLLNTLGVSAEDRTAVHGGRAIDALLRRNIVTGATMVVRRGLVESARPFPASWVHDEWLAMVAAATGEMDLLDEPLVDYRQHEGNQIGASSLDLGGRLGRLTASRGARNARLLARVTALQDRAGEFEPAPSTETLGKIDAKLAHERMRSALPERRIARVSAVLRALRAGTYRRYGLGLQDALRDLAQPV